MPPSTATQVRDVALDALHRVERHAGVGASARGRARSAGACPGVHPVLARRARRACRRTPRSSAGSAGTRCRRRRDRRRGPRSGNVAELRELRHLAAKGLQLEQLRADVGVQAGEREPGDALDPLDRRRGVAPSRSRTSSRPGPVEIFSCVSPRTSGRDPDQHRLGLRPVRARGGQPLAGGRSRRSCPPRSARPARPAPSRSSASDFALPCITIRSGAKPAFSARCSSPPEATSHHRPSSREQREHGGAGERLRGEHHVEVRVPASAPACTNARARARRSSSATT